MGGKDNRASANDTALARHPSFPDLGRTISPLDTAPRAVHRHSHEHSGFPDELHVLSFRQLPIAGETEATTKVAPQQQPSPFNAEHKRKQALEPRRPRCPQRNRLSFLATISQKRHTTTLHPRQPTNPKHIRLGTFYKIKKTNIIRIQVILRPDVPPWHTSATALAMCEQLSTHIGPDAGAFVLHRKRRITHVPYWWVNNPTLGEFCFAMIGRADIEGSKSDVAMDAWPPQASYPCGSISHAFAVRIRTENQDQVSICLFALREVSVLSELALGHLRYALTDVPPQSNSPPDTVIGAGRRATGWPDLTPKWTPLRAHSRFTD
ncbi:hypothetical protein niasHT_026019 [Heterodera trifolii]|uniref:Uncharacterized protein n=1 Tax=Heterodera trifolii TaxID=157864 RepID=A0ABD2JZS6_9BILA